MYKVYDSQDDQYGNVVVIVEADDGTIELPFFAVQQALKNRRVWLETTKSKVRFLVDGQIMSPRKMEDWSSQEYQSLPKCAHCFHILHDDVYRHQLSNNLFCSQKCADGDYALFIEELKDEEEIELD
jgi:hypothetical protein